MLECCEDFHCFATKFDLIRKVGKAFVREMRIREVKRFIDSGAMLYKRVFPSFLPSSSDVCQAIRPPLPLNPLPLIRSSLLRFLLLRPHHFRSLLQVHLHLRQCKLVRLSKPEASTKLR